MTSRHGRVCERDIIFNSAPCDLLVGSKGHQACNESMGIGMQCHQLRDLVRITVDSPYLELALSRITAYLKVKIWSLPKHENLTTGKKYCGKEEKLLLRSNFSSFPQYFQYTLTLRVYLHINFLNVINRIIFSSILKI